MVVKHLIILVVFSLLVVCGIVSAQNPDIMLISSDKADTALIANSHDTAVITVSLLEGMNPVEGVSVSLTVMNPVMGSLDTVTVISNGEGKATATFTAGTTPGIAEIRAETPTLTNSTTQRIVAPIPDESSYIISSTEWLIANSSDRATISVYAFNTSPSYSNYPISGLQVQFSVNNSVYGSFNPLTAITNSEGVAQSTFSTGYRSGTALLYGNLTYVIDAVPVQISLATEQKIDHDTPYRISEYNYTYRVEVGEITSIGLTFLDRWGNPVDNRRTPEEVNFSVSSPSALPKGAGFIDGSDYVRVKKVTVDDQGIARVDLKTDEVPGWNYITIRPLIYNSAGNQVITDKSLVIAGIPGKPVRIEAAFDPADFRLPADGASVFKISYTLWDKYDNYVQNRSVNVVTSIPGESKIVGTTAQGQAVLTYGPKWSIGIVEITATALDNTSVTHSQQVWFVPQEPADVLFTVSPQTMPSRDVPNRDSTWLIATIVDESGNPVNESVEVSFGFSGVTYDKIYDITSNPEIPDSTAMTDEYGIAMVEFLPGGFNSSNQTPATGRCDVSATWGGITRTVPVVWKNYPYLSVEAYASANLVQVNDTVDITILLKGDGYKLLPPPIDVVLCTDRSGSMLLNTSDGIIDDRMVHAMNAGRVFTSEMGLNDRIGVVSFGDTSDTSRWARLTPYWDNGNWRWNNVYWAWYWVKDDNLNECNVNDYRTSSVHHQYVVSHYPANPKRYSSSLATVDLVLSFNKATINSAINGMVPSGGTPMRDGLYKSVQLLQGARPEAVKAIILLSDGAWNTGGNPEGGSDTTWYQTIGTGSVINWANQSHVKIYSIALGNESWETLHPQLQSYASKTGGKFYWAPTADQLSAIYADIAGDLKTEAGVNTSMDLNYDKIIVNYTTEEINDPLNPIFDYNYSYGISTWINSYMTDGSEITIPNLPWNLDNSSEWAATRKLSFTLGTVHLYQVWEIRYRLVACQEGIFNLFGPCSTITFEGADEPLVLPDLVLKVNPETPGSPVESVDLYYTQIEQNATGSNPNFYVTFDIQHVYTGTKNVTEDYYIVTYDGRRHYLGSAILTPAEANQLRQYTILISRLPSGWKDLEPVLTEIGFEAPGPIIPAQPIPIVQVGTNPNRTYINLT